MKVKSRIKTGGARPANRVHFLWIAKENATKIKLFKKTDEKWLNVLCRWRAGQDWPPGAEQAQQRAEAQNSRRCFLSMK